MRIIIGVLLMVVVLIILGWSGLRVTPRPFDPYPGEAPEPESIPLPGDLPVPVERFYRAIYGDRIPVIESALIPGRVRVRVAGITCPGRFRFTHIAGQDCRHTIETTLFGVPIMKVNEYYLDG
jgi:hypothetical protein